ncbi:hypothetical protein ScPMuIL_002221, partial [Solemya velum]
MDCSESSTDAQYSATPLRSTLNRTYLISGSPVSCSTPTVPLTTVSVFTPDSPNLDDLHWYNNTFRSVFFAITLSVFCVTMFLFSTVFSGYYDYVMLTVRHISQEKLSSPVVLCGDFNAHNPLWGSERLDAKGRVIDSLLEKTDLVLLNDGEGSIPKSKHKAKSGVPWWDNECEEAKKGRQQAYNKLKRSTNAENFIDYKKKCAIVKRVTKNARRSCWREYCSRVTKDTSIPKIWRTIKRMSHINQTIGFPTIKDQKGTIIVNPQQKADAFANHFAN